MMLPPADMCGAAARAMFQGAPNRFIAESNMVWSESAARFSASVKGISRSVNLGPAAPALLTNTSIGPKAATVFATI